MRALARIAATLILGAGCQVPAIDLNDKSCDDAHVCLPGFVCIAGACQESVEGGGDAGPDASAAEPDASAAEPDASAAEPDASAAEPDASADTPDADAAEPDASAAEPDAGTGCTALPDGGLPLGIATWIPRGPETAAVDAVLAEYDCGSQLQIATAGGASGVVHLMWNSQALYAAYVVSDATPLALVQPNGSGDVWKDDAVEIFLDAPPLGGSTFDADDLHYIVNINRALLYEGKPGVDFAVLLLSSPSRYLIEIAVPWTVIGLTPSPGLTLGADFAIDDRRDFTNDLYLTADWAGVNPYGRPSDFGRITLAP